MRNLQPATFNDLKEVLTSYLGNQRREGDGRNTEQKERFRPTPQHTHNKSKPAEQKQFIQEKELEDRGKKQVECFRCGWKGHIKRDCRIKLEEANFVRDQDHLPKWTRPVINGNPVLGLIDTRCSKSVVHTRCVKPKDYLSWKIPYCTASSRKVHFQLQRLH